MRRKKKATWKQQCVNYRHSRLQQVWARAPRMLWKVLQRRRLRSSEGAQQ